MGAGLLGGQNNAAAAGDGSGSRAD